MASITSGYIFAFPLRSTASNVRNVIGARFMGGQYGASGSLSISGYTKLNGVAAKRRVVVITQPSATNPGQMVASLLTNPADGTYSVPNLPAGSYLVLDVMLDNSRQALVYDWVVAG